MKPQTNPAYGPGVGVTSIVAPVLEPRDPTPYNIGYDEFQTWINTTTYAIWVLEAYNSSTGQVLAVWKALAPIVVETRDPLSTDYTYPIGQTWVNSSTNNYWGLTSLTNAIPPVPTWTNLGGGSMQTETLTGNDSIAVGPTDGNINIKGDGTLLNITGNAGTSTLSVAILGGAVGTLLGGQGSSTPAFAANSAGNFAFTQPLTSSSAARTLTVSNSDTAHSTSNAQLILSTGGTSSGDPASIWSVDGATSWIGGIDNSASDAWVLSLGTSLGTTNKLSMSTGGALTLNNAFTFPSTDGTSSQILSTDGSGTVSWVNPSFSSAFITVSPTASLGQYTTISAALAVAVSGQTILVKEGTYTENLALVAGVNLVTWEANAYTPSVTVIGKCTFSSAGTVSISGINFQTNSDYILEVTGSAASIVNMINCILDCSNNVGIHYTSSSSSSAIYLYTCNFSLATTGISLFTCTSAGSINFLSSSGVGGVSNSSTPSTSSAGNVNAGQSTFNHPFSISGTGNIQCSFCIFSSTNSNTTALTLAGTGQSNSRHCTFLSGSASAISVGSGTQLELTGNTTVNSSNTNAITGLGTLLYGPIMFTGSSSTINASTATPLPTNVGIGTGLTFTATQLFATGDSGGVTSQTALTSTNATSVSSGTGTVKMTTTNNANSAAWIKIYIGVTAYWIPAWTTDAP